MHHSVRIARERASRRTAIMFKPGQVEVSQLPSETAPGYQLTLDYHVEGEAAVPEWACFHLHGSVGQVAVDERFRMHRDVAFNFLQRIGQRLRQRGLRVARAPLFGLHADYDPMFEDLRRQLHCQPGEPIDLERFLRSGAGD